MSNEEIVVLLQEGDSVRLGAEKLKGLQKILPSQEEVNVARELLSSNKFATICEKRI